ncbi:hypothetical protein HYH03_013248 [Edaphochlamys debaryana]|uniref:Uncharacterized protein n=1 Tax=Edaphochlamys debaryana TaxID=47281 RepID=A0A836BUL1_9CHLO|nr:hypothetical protein HYH03_013248 [Edaphochlamys debaryana]|eukprot:KAG2488098.1 hypothetical protein HYH03_013248 [Edaphochlamys debaryana]
MDRSPFLDGWRGESVNIMAVVRLHKRRSAPTLQAKLLGHTHLGHVNHEDARLFKDPRGRVYVYLALPMGAPPKRAVINTASRVLVHCDAQVTTCDVTLGFPRFLFYSDSMAMDKNWVPWNGTTLMSYSHYGTLGPHSVFDWKSYDEPEPHTGFDAVADHPIFQLLEERYGKLLHLSGGTPAILEPGGRSFLAVGHVRAHPGCFHPEATPAWLHPSVGLGQTARTHGSELAEAIAAAQGEESGGLAALAGLIGPTWSQGVKTTCAALVRAGNTSQKQSQLREAFLFRHLEDVGVHYPLEYAFFFYRFSATPPYNITHLSHGFIPDTGQPASHHTGIVFPIGLERLGSDDSEYLITYGESDQASRVLTMSAADVDAMLQPLDDWMREPESYTVCALQCAGDVAEGHGDDGAEADHADTSGTVGLRAMGRGTTLGGARRRRKRAAGVQGQGGAGAGAQAEAGAGAGAGGAVGIARARRLLGRGQH